MFGVVRIEDNAIQLFIGITAVLPINRKVAIPANCNWQTLRTKLGADAKGDIYEGLLEKNSEDTKLSADNISPLVL